MSQLTGRYVFLILFSLLFSIQLSSQDFVLTGGRWSIASNWQGGVIPPNPFTGNSITITGNTRGDVNNIEIADGSTFIVNSGVVFRIQVDGAGLFTNNGTIENNGTFRVRDNDQTFVNNNIFNNNSDGELDNQGILTNASTGKINNEGGIVTATSGNDDTFTNNGIFSNNLDGETDINGGGTFTNNNQFSNGGSAIVINRGAFINSTTGTIENAGDFTAGNSGSHSFMNKGSFNNNAGEVFNKGVFTNENTISNAAPATFINSGDFTNSAGGVIDSDGEFNLTEGNGDDFTNHGIINIKISSTLISNGVFINHNTVTIASLATANITGGVFTNLPTGTIDNNGTINNNSNLTNDNLFTNDGDLTNTKNITNAGTFDNLGSLINENTFDNEGDFKNDNLGAVDNNGKFNNYDGATITNNNVFDAGDDISGHQLDNNGTIVNNDIFSSDRQVINSATFINSATGSVNFAEDFLNEANGEVTNESFFSVGAGGENTDVTNNTGKITNNGTLANSGRLINAGTIENNSILTTANDRIVNQSIIINNGTINRFSGRIIQNTSSAEISGNGTFNLNGGELEANQGSISPGNSIGTMTINGDLTLGGLVTVVIEINGDGTSDFIDVSGTADLNGTLELIIGSGEFSDGETWTVLEAGTVSGSFSTLDYTFPPTVPDMPDPPMLMDSYPSNTTLITYTGATFLPIELASLSAEWVEQGVLLEWITATELNNHYMLVERSGEELVFEEIGRVFGRGTTVETQQYSFLDERPLQGINYYRLRQVDFDGTENFSNVIAINVDQPMEGLDIQLLPNPAYENIRINWQSSVTSDGGVIRLLDMASGKEIKRYAMPEGSSQMDIPVGDLPSGFYVVQIVQQDRQKAVKFIKR